MIQIEIINQNGRKERFRDPGPLRNAIGRANQVYARNAAEGRRVTVIVKVNGRTVHLVNKAAREHMARR